MDLITVVVPIYNVEKYLDRCIKSVVTQTYKNIEIILVNDGSPDKSDQIMKKWKKIGNRIICFYKQNGGLSDARNYAIKRAKGKYICFIDSDDNIDENYVKKLHNSIMKNKTLISWCNFNMISSDGTTKELKQNENDLWSFEMASACNKLFETSLFIKNDIFFPKGIWYEDLATTPKLLFIANNASYVDEPLYNYYYNPNSITKTYCHKALDMKKVLETLYDFADNKNLLNDKRIYEILEYIYLYSGIACTAFRVSMPKDTDMDEFKEMVYWIENRFPNIYKNNIAKKRLGIKMQFTINMVHHRMFSLLKVIIRFVKGISK